MKNSDRNLVRYILDSLNNNKECTHHDFLALVNKIYSHIPKGKILVNLKSKLFIAATFTACLFKKALPFIRNINQESSPLDEYSYDLVVDDSRIKEMIDEYNLFIDDKTIVQKKGGFDKFMYLYYVEYRYYNASDFFMIHCI